jgi:excisionase family DNA binding protein
VKSVLSPKELARAIGVSESSLKRWADAEVIRATRTAGGHRRIPIGEAIRFIRETGAVLVEPAVLGLDDVQRVVDEPTADGSDDTDRLFRYLEAGDVMRSRGFLMSLYLSGVSVAAIADGPVRGSMARIGELWEHSADGVFHEHRATDICLQALTQLRSIIEIPEDGPVAIGGAPASDPYLMPSLLAATVLASEGFQTMNLGPDTPVDALIRAAEHHQPRLIWLSVSAPADAPKLRSIVAALEPILERLDASLVVGGRQTEALRQIDGPRYFHASAMRELAAFARGLASSVIGPAPEGSDVP